MSQEAGRARDLIPDQVTLRRFLFAGLPVEIAFVGRDLCERFTRSMKHLQDPHPSKSEPVLRMELWDGSVIGLRRPFGDLRDAFADTTPFGDGVLTSAADRQIVGYQSPRAVTLLDFSSGRVLGWVSSAGELSRYEIGKPLQPILFAWYNSQKVQPVHAGLVARGDDGVLIGGKGGSGKSTTCLLCAKAGFSYLADDYVGLPPLCGDEQRAYSLYSTLWLEEEHSGHFEFLGDHNVQATQIEGEDKLPFSLVDAFPSRMTMRCRVRAIVLPQVAHISTSRLRSASPAEALLRLAPSSVLQLPFIDPAAALRCMAGLLRQVPAFWLDLGTDFDSIPLRIADALDIANAKDQAIASQERLAGILS